MRAFASLVEFTDTIYRWLHALNARDAHGRDLTQETVPRPWAICASSTGSAPAWCFRFTQQFIDRRRANRPEVAARSGTSAVGRRGAVRRGHGAGNAGAGGKAIDQLPQLSGDRSCYARRRIFRIPKSPDFVADGETVRGVCQARNSCLANCARALIGLCMTATKPICGCWRRRSRDAPVAIAEHYAVRQCARPESVLRL